MRYEILDMRLKHNYKLFMLTMGNIEVTLSQISYLKSHISRAISHI